MFVPHAQLLLHWAGHNSHTTACRAHTRNLSSFVKQALSNELRLSVTRIGSHVKIVNRSFRNLAEACPSADSGDARNEQQECIMT